MITTINRILGVPPEQRFISLIPVGYPTYTLSILPGATICQVSILPGIFAIYSSFTRFQVLVIRANHPKKYDWRYLFFKLHPSIFKLLCTRLAKNSGWVHPQVPFENPDTYRILPVVNRRFTVVTIAMQRKNHDRPVQRLNQPIFFDPDSFI